MPELPEVETIKRGLKKEKVLERTFVDLWCDAPGILRVKGSLVSGKKNFKSLIEGKKIEKIRRRAKNIIFDLSENHCMLIHQKMTGHLLVGKWVFGNGQWQAPPGYLSEKINSFLHVVFTMDDGRMLALSDVRKFAKIEIWLSEELASAKEFKALGPEPLEKAFVSETFKKIIRPKKGKIKQVLLDQSVIAGIGNIYSDEMLFRAKIHPSRRSSSLSDAELGILFEKMKDVLEKGIELGGESISDFRNVKGEKGNFDQARMVYRRTGEKCPVCGAIIKRIVIAGRSSHFCPNCQI